MSSELHKRLASHAESARRYADGRYPTSTLEEAASKAKAHAAAAEATAAEILARMATDQR